MSSNPLVQQLQLLNQLVVCYVDLIEFQDDSRREVFFQQRCESLRQGWWGGRLDIRATDSNEQPVGAVLDL